jgi:16S rRNA (cytosine1402-N4)-methyltransferase
MTSSVHIPVLLHEVVEFLTKPFVSARLPSWYLDGTLGGGGHVRAIANALKGNVNVIALDRDPHAIKRAEENLRGEAKRMIIENDDFRNLDKCLMKHGIQTVDMILLDLGISSDELETSGRGFSFQKDEPIHMTMGDPTSHLFTARTIVNEWKEEDIANVIYAYGEERFARRIARAIVFAREKKPIESSYELAEVVKMSLPAFVRRGKTHPATKTFQALRIAVNDELKALEEGLAKSVEHLSSKGRIAVISFHSLEDRIVKNYFKDIDGKKGKIITKRPLKPGDQEVAENPRSRSAKLRVFEKK